MAKAENIVKKRIEELETKRAGHEGILISKTRIGGDINSTLKELNSIRLRIDEARNMQSAIERGK